MNRIIALALALAGSPLAAEPCDMYPDRISVLVATKHDGWGNPDVEKNETNPGLFISWNCGPVQINAGRYKNSYGDQSNALTVAYPVSLGDWLEVSPFAGIASYPEYAYLQGMNYGDAVPMVGLQLRSGNLFAQVLPGDQEHIRAVYTAGFTFDLGGMQ